MKGLLFSDLHVYPFAPFAKVLDDGMNSRLAEILDVIGRLVVRSSEDDIDFVVVSGDVFNEKDKVNIRAFTEAAVLLSTIQKPCLMVTGNHDFVTKKKGVVTFSALSIMKELGDNFYLDEEMIIGGQKFIGIPYYEDIKTHYERIFRAKDPSAILVTHAVVKGTIDGTYLFPSGLPLELLTEFKAAVVGHIHTPQLMEREQVLVPGSPLHHDFGDIRRRALAWVMTIEDKSVRFEPFEVPGPRFVEIRAEEWSGLHPAQLAPGWYYRVIGEIENKPDNVICVPKVEESTGVGRGSVSLRDSKSELLEKWLKFKGIPEEKWAEYLKYADLCL